MSDLQERTDHSGSRPDDSVGVNDGTAADCKKHDKHGGITADCKKHDKHDGITADCKKYSKHDGIRAGFKKYGKHYAVVKKNREFSFLFKKGETAGNPAFVAYYRQNNRRVNRLGIVTSKKAGNAVKRARARRLLREAFRLLEPDLLSQTDRRFDLIIVARESLAAMKMQDVKARLQRVFTRMLNPAASPPSRRPPNSAQKNKQSNQSNQNYRNNRHNKAGNSANHP